MKQKKAHFRKLILVSVCSVGLITSASASNQIKLDLPAEKNMPESIREPVRYDVQPPGEYRDVDLPDVLKNKDPLYLTENTSSRVIANTSTSLEKEFSIQVAMFKNRFNAERYKEKLLAQHLRVYLLEKKNKNNQPRYYIRIGHYQSRQQAETVLKGFVQRSGMQAFIVSD